MRIPIVEADQAQIVAQQTRKALLAAHASKEQFARYNMLVQKIDNAATAINYLLNKKSDLLSEIEQHPKQCAVDLHILDQNARAYAKEIQIIQNSSIENHKRIIKIENNKPSNEINHELINEADENIKHLKAKVTKLQSIMNETVESARELKQYIKSEQPEYLKVLADQVKEIDEKHIPKWKETIATARSMLSDMQKSLGASTKSETTQGQDRKIPVAAKWRVGPSEEVRLKTDKENKPVNFTPRR